MFGGFAVASMLAFGLAACGDGNPSGSNGDGSGSSVVTSPSIKAEKGTVKDSRDGKVYKTVKIGTQTWMAENLNYAYTGVPYKSSNVVSTGEPYKLSIFTSDSTSWCYDNDPANCEKYGRLYTWSAVMDSAAQFSENAGTKCGFRTECTPNTPHRGICPKGWHVPSEAEFESLLAAVGSSEEEKSLNLRAVSWKNGTDKFGFSALPAGVYSSDGEKFGGLGSSASFWTSTEDGRDLVYHLGIGNLRAGDDFSIVDGYAYVDYSSIRKDNGVPVRCLQDN